MKCQCAVWDKFHQYKDLRFIAAVNTIGRVLQAPRNSEGLWFCRRDHNLFCRITWRKRDFSPVHNHRKRNGKTIKTFSWSLQTPWNASLFYQNLKSLKELHQWNVFMPLICARSQEEVSQLRQRKSQLCGPKKCGSQRKSGKPFQPCEQLKLEWMWRHLGTGIHFLWYIHGVR